MALKDNWCSKALSAGYIWEFWALIVNDICPSLTTNHLSMLVYYTWWVLTLIWWITRYLNLCSRQQYFSSSDADVNSTTNGFVWRNFCSRVVFKILKRLNTVFAKNCFFPCLAVLIIKCPLLLVCGKPFFDKKPKI